jgi:hypothetical protein
METRYGDADYGHVDWADLPERDRGSPRKLQPNVHSFLPVSARGLCAQLDLLPAGSWFARVLLCLRCLT